MDKETRGQAESAYIGLKDINYTDGIYIFNIDTIRHDYTKPDFINNCDGYLEVFEGEGKHWSFILPDQNGNVSRTTEKIRISNLCSDGLYYFKDKYIFESAFNNAVKKNNEIAGEYYVAPLYNTLIQDGKVIKYELVNNSFIDFCGTPEEYNLLLSQPYKFVEKYEENNF